MATSLQLYENNKVCHPVIIFPPPDLPIHFSCCPAPSRGGTQAVTDQREAHSDPGTHGRRPEGWSQLTCNLCTHPQVAYSDDGTASLSWHPVEVEEVEYKVSMMEGEKETTVYRCVELDST